MEKSLAEDKGNIKTEVERLKVEVLEAKNISFVRFKESKAYRSSLTSTNTIFLAKEKVKIERPL